MEISSVLKYFGTPDFKRNSERDGIKVNEIAYMFNYHANKDWVCIVTFNSSGIKSVGYGKTIGITFGGWVKYE